ncbi:hypothetical protein SAMN05216241_11069 [Limimonas halophila]|uniref:Uncharacterized protein n=1 Tax=Limimonas halophila TaxID=1082479 RepID=A0A1G7TTP2_9PROT|nr:hypothetical protein [Limimonas halophila]SDG38615.1 hypothetical protein SAMN05216241_11069 [Limimonas halophila]
MLNAALIDGLALPFIAALVVAGGTWLLAGKARTNGFAGALGVIAGFATGLVGVLGWPDVPPSGAVEKLPWLAPLGLLAGWAALRVSSARGRLLVVAGAVSLALLWLGWPRLAVPHADAWVRALLVGAAATWVLTRAAEAPGRGHAGRVMLATIAAAAIGLYGSSYAMAQLVGVLAATLAGALTAVGWSPRGVGSLMHLTTGLPLVGLVTILALYTQAEPLALALLAPVLLADTVRDALFGAARPQSAGSPAAALGQHALTLAVALLPAGVAVLVAIARSQPLYY